MDADIWAVSPVATANTAYFRVAATHTAAALVLLQSNFSAAGAINGSGYRITLTSVGDLTGVTYTIVGIQVGSTAVSTVAIAGGSTATVTTTQYWSRVDSITPSGTSAASTMAVGYAVNLALPRTRIRGYSYVAFTSAGTLVVQMNGTAATNQTILNIDTPAVASSAFGGGLMFPGDGILVGRSAASTDFAVVTLTQITRATLFCG